MPRTKKTKTDDVREQQDETRDVSGADAPESEEEAADSENDAAKDSAAAILWDEWEDPEDIVAGNEEYLEEFLEDLENAGLSDGTIERHMGNAALFLNDWLAGREGGHMEDGPEHVDGFLGNWYIRRCMWSTPSNIKTTATSLKKFYKSMVDHGHIEDWVYKWLVQTIKEKTPEWQYKCALYNNPMNEWDDISDEFDPFV